MCVQVQCTIHASALSVLQVTAEQGGGAEGGDAEGGDAEGGGAEGGDAEGGDAEGGDAEGGWGVAPRERGLSRS